MARKSKFCRALSRPTRSLAIHRIPWSAAPPCSSLARNRSRLMHYRLWLLPAAALLLPSCMVGPNYARPAAPVTPAYKEAPQTYQGDEIWKPVHPSDGALRTAWWELFGDDELNSLEQQVAGANQELKAAEARFREARALVGFARADEFPTIGVGPGISSLRESPNQPYFPLASSFATGELVLPVDLSYEIDLWGRIRRGVAAAGEKAQASAADLESVNPRPHAEPDIH